ncbi:MAG: hypothetical protein IK115_10060 [Lachnospiraceae bacterium]|nr:hypothetical protein [Lachnospiraceae bacterium]
MKIRKRSSLVGMLLVILLAMDSFFIQVNAGDSDEDGAAPGVELSEEEPEPIPEPEPEPEPTGEQGSMVIREDIYYEVMQKTFNLIHEWGIENGISGEYRLTEGLTKLGLDRATEVYLMDGVRPNGENSFNVEGTSVCGQTFRATSRAYDENSYRTSYDSDAIAQEWFDSSVKRCVETNLRSGCCGDARNVGIACVNHPGNGLLFFFYIGYDRGGDVTIQEDALNTERTIEFKSEHIRFDTKVPDSLAVGETADISILAHSTCESDRERLKARINGISYSSDDESILKVTENGSLKGLKAGTAKLTVSAPGYGTKEFSIQVTGSGSSEPPTPEPPRPEDIVVADAGSATLAAKQKLDISAAVSEAITAEGIGNLKYVSQDKRTAGVTKKGVVTAKKAGTTSIEVYTAISGQKVLLATYTVHVTKPVLKFTRDLTCAGASLEAADFVSDLPEGQKVSWAVPSSTKVAVIDSDSGEIRALKNGKVKVSCIIGEGKYAAKYKATLKVWIPKAPRSVKLKEGGYKTVTLKNVSSYTQVEWFCDESEGIQIVDTPKYNKVRIYGITAGMANLRAVVDGQEYGIPVIVR